MKSAVLEAPAGPYQHRFKVRFQDVDAAGIVFFARIFDYIHDGYVAFMESRGVDFSVALEEKSWIAPLKHAEADYIGPARYGDAVYTEVVGKHIDGSKVIIFHRLVRDDGRVLAAVRTDHVFVDFESFERVPLTDAVLAAFEGVPDLGLP